MYYINAPAAKLSGIFIANKYCHVLYVLLL